MTAIQRSGPSLAVVVPIVLVVACTALAGWLLLPGDDPDRGPVNIRAEGPRYGDLKSLVAASDIVVEGTVVDTEKGRALTDPGDPDVGIVTRLAHVAVVRVVAGDIGSPLVIEQEAELLDGTALRVNGVTPLTEGDRGLMFLIRGDTDEFPYTAFVNEQSWVPIIDDRLAPLDPTDPVWTDLARHPASDAVVQIDALAPDT